jgi:hypothetical protein
MYEHIPFYVKLKKHYTGLCPYHDKGIHFSAELKRLRKIWHVEKCQCPCTFCKVCKHGENPIGERSWNSCHDGSCDRCRPVMCPLEWSKEKTTKWTEYIHTKDENKRLKIVKTLETKTNAYISGRLYHELTIFESHEDHNEFFKTQMAKIFSSLQRNHVVIDGIL